MITRNERKKKKKKETQNHPKSEQKQINENEIPCKTKMCHPSLGSWCACAFIKHQHHLRHPRCTRVKCQNYYKALYTSDIIQVANSVHPFIHSACFGFEHGNLSLISKSLFGLGSWIYVCCVLCSMFCFMPLESNRWWWRRRRRKQKM